MRRRSDASDFAARVAGALTALLTLVATSSNATAGNVRVCQGQEQDFEQKRSTATTLELNAALFAAAEKGCAALANRLLDAGASLKARDRLGATPLSRAAAAGEADIVALFLDHGAMIDARNLDGSTALFLAAEGDKREAVKTLIARGADANLAGRSGVAPLAAAAFAGRDEVVQLLLDHRVDPNAEDDTGKSAICYGAGRGFPAVVRQLLNAGVDPNRRYGNELTALMWAAGYSDEAGTRDAAEILTLLLDRGARLDDKDNRGRTALMIAASLGHSSAVDVLVARGANAAGSDP